MISKFRAHGTGGVCSYNVLVSKRQDMILSENNIQAKADQMIFKTFQDTSFMVMKIMVKVRKRPDCTTTFRRAIAPVDDITLRV